MAHRMSYRDPREDWDGVTRVLGSCSSTVRAIRDARLVESDWSRVQLSPAKRVVEPLGPDDDMSVSARCEEVLKAARGPVDAAYQREVDQRWIKREELRKRLQAAAGLSVSFTQGEDSAWFVVVPSALVVGKMVNFCSTLAEMWHTKSGDLVDELCDNLICAPVSSETRRPVLHHMALGGAEYKSESLPAARALLQLFYSQEGVNTDLLMGFAVPLTGNKLTKENFQEYRKMYQDRYDRNPAVDGDFPRGLFPLGGGEKKMEGLPDGRLGGAPKALFRIWNWAMRTVYVDPQGPEAGPAMEQLQKWVKTLVALCAAADDIQKDFLAASFAARVSGPTAAEVRARAEVACTEGLLYRGFCYLPDKQYAYYKALRPGEYVAVQQPTSTSLFKSEASKFMNGPNALLYIIEMPPKGTPLWQTSQYPKEAEILLPACMVLEVVSPPVVRRRQQTLRKVPMSTLTTLKVSCDGKIKPSASLSAAHVDLCVGQRILNADEHEVIDLLTFNRALRRLTERGCEACEVVVETEQTYIEVHMKAAAVDIVSQVPAWDTALRGGVRELGSAELVLEQQKLIWDLRETVDSITTDKDHAEETNKVTTQQYKDDVKGLERTVSQLRHELNDRGGSRQQIADLDGKAKQLRDSIRLKDAELAAAQRAAREERELRKKADEKAAHMRQQIVELDGRVRQLEDSVGRKDTELAVAQRAVREEGERRKNADEDAARMLEAAEDGAQRARQEAAAARARADAAEEQSAAAQRQLKLKDDAIRELEGRIERLRGETQQLQRQIDDRDALEAENGRLERHITELQDLLEDAKGRAALQGRQKQDEAAAEADQLKRTISHQERAEQLARELAATRDQARKLEAQLSAAQTTELQDLQVELAEAEVRRSALEGQLRRAVARARGLEQEKEELSRELEELRRDLAARCSNYADLRARLAAAEAAAGERDELQQELDARKAELAELRHRLKEDQAAAGERDALRLGLDARTDELAELRRCFNETQKALRAAEARVRELEAELQAAGAPSDAQLRELQRKLAEAVRLREEECARADTLERELGTSEQERRRLQRLLEEAERRVDQLEAQQRELAEAQRAAEVRAKELQRQAHAASARAAEISAEAEGLRMQRDDLERDKYTLEGRLKELERQKKKLEDERRELERNLEDSAKHAVPHGDLQEARALADDLRRQLEEARLGRAAAEKEQELAEKDANRQKDYTLKDFKRHFPLPAQWVPGVSSTRQKKSQADEFLANYDAVVASASQTKQQLRRQLAQELKEHWEAVRVKEQELHMQWLADTAEERNALLRDHRRWEKLKKDLMLFYGSIRGAFSRMNTDRLAAAAVYGEPVKERGWGSERVPLEPQQECTYNELRRGLAAVHMESHLEDLCKVLDYMGNGTVSQRDFVALMEARLSPDDIQQRIQQRQQMLGHGDDS